jgi:uncharacterized protein
MKKLTELVKEDPRIKKVYDYAKEKYDEANLTQHNFEHVIRVLFRALTIADTEKNANFKILIPATLLHDVGATVGDYRHHEEAGISIAKEVLPKFGYSQREIEAICHCILAHEGRSEPPKTLEAKILCDSDILEKSDLLSVYFAGRVQFELKRPLDEFIGLIVDYAKRSLEHGFYTKKASEIDNDGLERRLKLDESIAEVSKKRKDFLVKEADVW